MPDVLSHKADKNKDLSALLVQLRAKEASGTITAVDRNEFVFRVISQIDGDYQQYVEALETTRDTASFLAETTSTTLSTVATLVGVPDTKSILSATSALITGAETSSEKNFFQKQTTNAITNEMDLLRLAVLTDIKKGTELTIDQYTLEQSLVDLKSYLYAGTLPRALNGIEQQTASQLNQQQKAGQSTIAVTPSSVDFGSVPLPAASPASKSVTVTNQSNTSLTISGVSLTPPGGQFNISPDECSGKALAQNGSCSFSVTFIPVAGTTSKSTVAINYNGSDSPKNTTVSGSNSYLTLNPASNLDFGTISNGAASQKTVTVTNTSAGAVNITAAAIAPAATFVISANACTGAGGAPLALASGSNCTLSLTFASAGVPANATLTITSGAPAPENTKTLNLTANP